jgi:hypothetical protein
MELESYAVAEDHESVREHGEISKHVPKGGHQHLKMSEEAGTGINPEKKELKEIEVAPNATKASVFALLAPLEYCLATSSHDFSSKRLSRSCN